MRSLTKRLRSIVRTGLSSVTELLQAREGPYRGKFLTRAAAELAAESAASRGRRVGYDHAEAAQMYLHEVRTLRSSDYPVLYWLEKRLGQDMRIFDWGGNLGHSYHAYGAYLAYPTGLVWTICDVPEITRAGERLAQRWNARGLRFTNAPEECDGCDVLLVSGALQYMPQSLDELLDKLRVRPRAIVINRTPVLPTSGYYTLQDIGPAVCVYRVFAENALLQLLSNRGYTLRDRWPCEGKSIRIPFHPSETVERYTGFFFELDSSAPDENA